MYKIQVEEVQKSKVQNLAIWKLELRCQNNKVHFWKSDSMKVEITVRGTSLPVDIVRKWKDEKSQN